MREREIRGRDERDEREREREMKRERRERERERERERDIYIFLRVVKKKTNIIQRQQIVHLVTTTRLSRKKMERGERREERTE